METHAEIRSVAVRWTLLAALLTIELLAMTATFDAQRLSDRSDILAGCIAKARLVPEISISVAAALVVAGWRRLQAVGVKSALLSVSHHPWRRSLLVHLAGLGGLLLASTRVFDDETHSPLWLVAWLVLATVTISCWFAALAPIRAWAAFVRREWRIATMAAAVGCFAWCAGHSTRNLWKALGNATFGAVAMVLEQFYPSVVVWPQEHVLTVEDFSVEIAPQCSGFEGIGLMAVFLVAFFCLFRKCLRFPHALLLLPVGLGGMWVGNVLRISALVVIGASWSPDIALKGFHSQAGWIAFNLLALILITAALQIRFFSRIDGAIKPDAPSVSAQEGAGVSHAGAYLVPLLAITAVGTACAALQSGFDVGYPIKVVAGGIGLWYFRRSFRQLSWNASWTAVVAGSAVFALWIMFDTAFKTPESSSIPINLSQLAPGWAAVWIIFRVIGSVVAVPLAEELAFRGYLMRRWGAVSFEQVAFVRCSWPAVAVSSILFGLLHERWIAGSLAGLVYALILRRRGNFGDAVVAHAVTNVQIAAMVVFTGAWHHWG